MDRRPAAAATSDYTGQQIYYRSIQERETDLLTTLRLPVALGHRLVLVLAARSAPSTRWLRRLWPRRWRRSDVYMRMLGLDRRFGIADRLDRRAGRPQRERVIQDVEVPVERLPEFLDWFDEEVGMRPVWLCPLIARPATGRRTRWSPGRTYVNVGFWGTVHVGPDAADAPRNRAIEAKVHELGGHKSPLLRGVLRPRHLRPALRRRHTWPPSRSATTPTTD